MLLFVGCKEKGVFVQMLMILSLLREFNKTSSDKRVFGFL